ncbi:putative Xaa-Pro aminopeptidase [Sporormia fimetaria CBS 119925]|uniref:Xaa-Pro aminopeptidase n=1 Tax=Sporormia fimetaria CBS 119925 TaxID=1340428 RepID=A0A6A6VIC9_9PLEO|nr:putative Xaa-Pro aminopeptidase [Sporormia fimetaria CBS 119925]
MAGANMSELVSAARSFEDVLKGKYPAKTHARKVKEWIVKNGGDEKGTLYLESARKKLLEDSDSEAPFRQRRYFFYLSGCELADSYLTYEMSTEKLTLFIPPVEPDEVIWCGLPMSTEQAKQKYEVDDVRTTTDINPYLTSSNTSPQTTIYAIANQVSDDITFLSYKEKDFTLLKPAIETGRVIKTPYEIALIRKANDISTAAHINVMRAVKSSHTEAELYGVFLKSCIERGSKEQAYHSIVAAGENGATLHYVHNDDTTTGKDVLLLDAGCEVDCYASDITRTFPISGEFSKESAQIYAIVLQMQKQCIAALKAGIKWDDIHELAHRIAIQGLLDLGILRGDANEILAARTSVAFFPHGLGHYLGLDTHDTGGNPNYKDSDPMFRYLRLRGIVPAGSVVTVEPGIYFCRFIIEPYLRDERQRGFIDEGVLERFWSVGGVRIEDNILITEEGCENLTPTPKEMEEVRGIVNGQS